VKAIFKVVLELVSPRTLLLDVRLTNSGGRILGYMLTLGSDLAFMLVVQYLSPKLRMSSERRTCAEKGVLKFVRRIVIDCSSFAESATSESTMLRESLAATVHEPTTTPGV
jgi:hypothetical protein